MKFNNFKQYKIMVGVAISLAALISCNSGTSNDGSTTHLGDFNVSTNNMMALNGSEWVYVSLEDSWNNEVANIKVTNSDDSVITVSQNTCTQLSPDDVSCKFFIQGTNIGSSTLTVSADGFNSVVESITVERNWGIVGGDQDYGIGNLSVSGDNVYAQSTAYDLPYVYVSNNGQPWQILGNSQAYESGLENWGIASDESHVCAFAEGVVDHTSKGIVSCITNGSSWNQLPNLPGAFFGGISIYQGKVYVEIFDGDGYNAKYCPIDNCTEWQQLGQPFPNFDMTTNTLGMFESTALIESGNGVYFLDTNGSWSLYGTYTPGTSNYINALYTESEVFVMPLNESFLGPFNQEIEYNNLSDLGGDFSFINNGINVNAYACASRSALANRNNTIYAAPQNGNIYASINVNGIWSDWSQIGSSTVPICNIYTNNDGTKLYSLYTDSAGHGQIYIYSLK